MSDPLTIPDLCAAAHALATARGDWTDRGYRHELTARDRIHKAAFACTGAIDGYVFRKVDRETMAARLSGLVMTCCDVAEALDVDLEAAVRAILERKGEVVER